RGPSAPSPRVANDGRNPRPDRRPGRRVGQPRRRLSADRPRDRSRPSPLAEGRGDSQRGLFKRARRAAPFPERGAVDAGRDRAEGAEKDRNRVAEGPVQPGLRLLHRGERDPSEEDPARLYPEADADPGGALHHRRAEGDRRKARRRAGDDPGAGGESLRGAPPAPLAAGGPDSADGRGPRAARSAGGLLRDGPSEPLLPPRRE